MLWPLMIAGVSALIVAPYALTAASRSQPVPTRHSTAGTVAAQSGEIGNRFHLPECPVTIPNGETPPGEQRSAGLHGNGVLWTALWSEGTVVFRPGGSGFVLTDGSLQMKFPWWRGIPGPLTIEGRRVDAPAPPLRAHIPNGYRGSFQATGLTLPHSRVLGSHGPRREREPDIRRGRCKDRRGAHRESAASGRRPTAHAPGGAA